MIRISEKALSRKFNLLRFIAILCVVMAHSENYVQFGFADGSTAYFIEQKVLASMEWVVSMFFMISAYLLFRGFQWNQLFGKWKRRVHTLLIPYLIWNTIFFCLFALLPRIPFFASFINSPPAPLTVSDVLNAIFLHQYTGFLWFLKTLILLTLFSPVYYLLFSKKYLAEFTLGALLICLFLQPFEFPAVLNLHFRFLFFYGLGAYIALRFPDFARVALPRAIRITLLAAIPLFVVLHCFYYSELYSIAVILSLWFGVHTESERASSVYDTSFFVYLTHFLALSPIKKVLYALLPHTETGMLISYFTAPLIAVGLLVPLALFVRRYLPKIYSVLFGGR